ncbi:hypothetical protein RvY_11231 [Ramazzottius varieornatus]|uniref:Uncharacterized protein n=1 Tax=Ramazzottius varieornatus TaxID=947166 RepID=A0A1D1VFG3_RAMVA|nr:hypothetical protein RvY_11231 [Ramazzottius varieornatus]
MTSSLKELVVETSVFKSAYSTSKRTTVWLPSISSFRSDRISLVQKIHRGEKCCKNSALSVETVSYSRQKRFPISGFLVQNLHIERGHFGAPTKGVLIIFAQNMAEENENLPISLKWHTYTKRQSHSQARAGHLKSRLSKYVATEVSPKSSLPTRVSSFFVSQRPKISSPRRPSYLVAQRKSSPMGRREYYPARACPQSLTVFSEMGGGAHTARWEKACAHYGNHVLDVRCATLSERDCAVGIVRCLAAIAKNHPVLHNFLFCEIPKAFFVDFFSVTGSLCTKPACCNYGSVAGGARRHS